MSTSAPHFSPDWINSTVPWPHGLNVGHFTRAMDFVTTRVNRDSILEEGADKTTVSRRVSCMLRKRLGTRGDGLQIKVISRRRVTFDASSAPEGWYMVVQLGSTGEIENVYLTHLLSSDFCSRQPHRFALTSEGRAKLREHRIYCDPTAYLVH
jgi:hypothetical protein